MPTEISTVVRPAVEQLSAGTDSKAAAIPVPDTRQVLPEGGNTVPDNSSSSKVSNDQVDQIVEELNVKVQDIRRELHFQVNAESGQTIISVVDTETQEVIRQIPPEEVVALAEHLEKHSGILMSARA